MQGGFSFCGVDIGKLGLEYVPSIENAYVYSGSTYDASEQIFEGHHGGYFYGTTVQPKVFNLRCMFQEKHINHGFLSSIEGFFYRGRTGKLIFDQNDWMWYIATVVDIDENSMVTFMNGFVTITLKAYYPFGRCDSIYLSNDGATRRSIAENTALLNKNMTPTTSFEQINTDKDILIYNGGSENAACAIQIAGNAGEGITITNKTTGQESRFVLFTDNETTNEGKTVICDSLNGKTVLASNDSSEIKFLYHDGGFIEFAPAYPIERNVFVSWTNGSKSVSGFNVFNATMVGKHIYLGDQWKKIASVTNENTIILEEPMQSTGSGSTTIAQMNEISIKLGANASISKLNFLYNPTFK